MNKAYTVFYSDCWMAGSHQHCATYFRRVTCAEGESVEDMLRREDLMDSALYVFHGHPLQEGERSYACYCDLEPGMEPDKCVIDSGIVENCRYAQPLLDAGKTKWQCKWWRDAPL